jgi:transposase
VGGKSGPNPTDRAKGGVKRSVLTEAAGIPVGIVVEGAKRPDMKLVADSLCSVPQSIEDKRLEHLVAGKQEQGLCLDAGYDYDEVREIAQAFGYTTHIRSRGEEKKAKEAGKKARRWVVERTHSWLNRYRRLLVRWEKKAHNYLALLHFACALITWNRGLFG